MSEISLCMIVKNEEANVESCLSSVAAFVDEIVIVDTGSTDRTKEIALRYTGKVYDFPWVDDFSAARNYSISKASNEYILVLDGDEQLLSMDRDEIERLKQAYPEGVGRILLINQYTRKDYTYRQQERLSRLFSKEFYHYEGRIHEQLIRFGKREAAQEDGIVYEAPVTVKHLGYEGDLAVRRSKTQRNIKLLKKAREQEPNDPYLLYQLGKSFYMEEDYKNACVYFEQALYFDLNPRLEYVQDMVESYGYTLINTGQYEKSLQLLSVYEEFSHSADFLFLSGLIRMNNGEFEGAIREFKKAAEKSYSKVEGVNGDLAFYNIGAIYECLGDYECAGKYYRKCRDYEPALRRLKDMVE